MRPHDSETRFVVCLKNEGYVASPEVRKIYQVIPDTRIARHRLMRVIDESGEDYLYPMDYFASIELPQVAVQAFALAA